MDMKDAIRLILKRVVSCAITNVNIIALSEPFLFPVPGQNTDRPGSRVSLEIAWSKFDAPTTPIRAEKKEVANSPRSMRAPERLVYYN